MFYVEKAALYKVRIKKKQFLYQIWTVGYVQTTIFIFHISLSLPELITSPTYLNSGTAFSDLPSS
jgi:hypothetical protein